MLLTAQALREIEERAEKGRQMISDLCARRRDWIMSIPAQPDYDPDLVLAAAIKGVTALLADRKALVEVLRDLRWKSIDKDNMEFECRVTCYEMDTIRAILQEDR